MHMRDWFNINAIVPPLSVLFGFAFGLFARPVGPSMTISIQCLWIAGAIVLAALTWFSAAKAHQNVREANEDARKANDQRKNEFQELRQLILRPGTTLADVKTVV